MPIKLPQVGADSEPLSGCLTRGLVAFHKRITCKIGVHHIEHPNFETNDKALEVLIFKGHKRIPIIRSIVNNRHFFAIFKKAYEQ
jgi:hypothetical protein